MRYNPSLEQQEAIAALNGSLWYERCTFIPNISKPKAIIWKSKTSQLPHTIYNAPLKVMTELQLKKRITAEEEVHVCNRSLFPLKKAIAPIGEGQNASENYRPARTLCLFIRIWKKL